MNYGTVYRYTTEAGYVPVGEFLFAYGDTCESASRRLAKWCADEPPGEYHATHPARFDVVAVVDR